MGYIGVEPALGRNREVDDISSSFDGTTTQFNLTVQSLAVSPGSANGLLISVGGVVQNPNTDYTVNASQLTFTTAPASGLDFWGLMLGQGIDTQAVADGTITNSSISGSAAIALSKLATGALPTAITVTSANISDLSIVNADVNASAAIAGTKISPDFGSQGITTTGVISMGNGLTLTGTNPFIDIVDSNNNDDFTVKNDNGTFKIQDKTNSVDRFAIDSNGNVGIGTASPTSTLFVNGTSSSHIFTARTADSNGNCIINILSEGTTGNSRILFSDSNGADAIISYSHNDGGLIFGSHGAVEDMRIDASGRVLIGHSIVTPVDNDANNPIFQVEGTSADDSRISIRHNSTTSGNAASIYLSRSKGTSTGSKTSVASGDALGNLIFMGADGTHDTRGAIIQASCDGTPGDNDMPGRLEFLTTPDGGLNATQKMVIKASGNVGINTDSPSQFLEVNGNISVGNGGSSGGSEMLRIFNDSGLERIHATNNPSGFAFGIGGTSSGNEAFRIDGNRKVLINLTAPPSTGTSGTESAKLQVNISGTSGTAVGFMDTGGFDTNVMVMNHARAGANSGAFSGTMIQFRNSSNTSVGGIVCGASTTTYLTSSDYRLKENEVLISDGITRLKQLKPYRFNFKITPNIIQDGFFAHEAQAVVPQAVTGTKDGMRPETYYLEGDTLPSGKVVGDVKTYSSSEIDIQQLDYSQLVPLLVAAVQELIGKVEALEAT